jgi:hypothetical protein
MLGQRTQRTGRGVLEQLMEDFAAEAYVYGYPLVLMDVTRQIRTNVPRPTETAAPLNQFANMRSLPADPSTALIPDVDSLYTFAFVDLSKEPMILSVPDMSKRYCSMRMLDAWGNALITLGTRTAANWRTDFAVIGPRQAGRLPDVVNVIKSPTNFVRIIGRTQTNGKDDYALVHEIQNQYRLTPLSAWGTSHRPPSGVAVDKTIDMRATPDEQVARMDAATFFSRLNALMRGNPPATVDAESVNRFAGIGIGPGEKFEMKNVAPTISKGLEEGVREGHARIVAEAKKPLGQTVNGWHFVTDAGPYGTDYLRRAVLAFSGLEANLLPEDAVCPRTASDANGEPLIGSSQYEIHFGKGELPPVEAFWSITMYNSGLAFVRNPIRRYAIGDRDNLKFDDDGSLTLYIQNEPPTKERESNWLPSPRDSFSLIMRLYWPKSEILTGGWMPPEVKRVEAKRRQTA